MGFRVWGPGHAGHPLLRKQVHTYVYTLLNGILNTPSDVYIRHCMSQYTYITGAVQLAGGAVRRSYRVSDDRHSRHLHFLHTFQRSS